MVCIKVGIVPDPMKERSPRCSHRPLGPLRRPDLRGPPALEQAASPGYPANNFKLPLLGNQTKKETAAPSNKELLEVIEGFKKQVEQLQLNQRAASHEPPKVHKPAAPQRNLDAAMEPQD